MGFERTWVSWIMSCVSTVTYKVLLNGRSHGFIKRERGIRQCDPLSPFLFILCAEALVSCLNRSEALGKLHGICLAPPGPAVHHLLFADDSLLMCRASVEEAEELISGSKRKLLNFLQEKLQGRLRGYYAKALSQGGKEVLIKSVGLALPVYAMSVFKLPIDLFKKLTSAMTEFWWSSGDNKRKIPWVAWQKLCRDKDKGGLGFHDIGKFNQSLLGKQAWRIWKYPNSLLAQILRNRYFKNGDFLGCAMGARPSYAWRSLLHGRELLSQGLVKAIGDGKETRVWGVNWIIDEVPRPLKYRADSTIDLTLHVSDLINQSTGQWETTRVQQVFSQHDAIRVLQLKTNILRRDTWVWGFSKNGEYSSRSGYKFLETLQDLDVPASASLPPLEKQLWSDLWKTKTSPKLRHFFWRALSGALAVKERLRSRGIMMDSTCDTCRAGPESICHVLFTCPKAKEVWERSSIPLPPAGFSTNSTFLNLHYLLSCSKNKSINANIRLSFPWILWHLWKSRNALFFEHIHYDAAAIITKVKEDVDIWFQVEDPTPCFATSSATTQPGDPKWRRPPPNSVKCNIGASWHRGHFTSGASWIVRDQSGLALLSHSRRSYAMVSSPTEAELLSFYWAIESLKNLHFREMIFESSLALAKEALLLPDLFPQFRPLLDAIFSLLQTFESWSFVHISGTGNRIANAIANSVMDFNLFQSYVGSNGPVWLHDLLLDDAASG
ncbi:unnamed protein product [Microthlaspi erraticum]|uniref:Reverse transcriptase domain-containing protein n=1 Tax=Microthlaspi erraticum TaxID=1685480 RepID=A0A6D2JK52_9BRAS|nr:unnamed protein product [Microthlaspi erraticum]